MNFFDQIINKFQIISDPLSFIGVLFTIIVSLYIFKHENFNSFTRERHDKVIFPLFNLLEPFLYHDVPKDTLESALQVIEDNKNLADGKLLEVSYFCTKTLPKIISTNCFLMLIRHMINLVASLG